MRVTPISVLDAAKRVAAEVIAIEPQALIQQSIWEQLGEHCRHRAKELREQSQLGPRRTPSGTFPGLPSVLGDATRKMNRDELLSALEKGEDTKP